MKSAFVRYANIFRHHGIKNRVRRSWEQFTEVDLYDFTTGIESRKILIGEEYLESGSLSNGDSVSYYQPNYTAATRKPLQYLMRRHHEMGSVRLVFIDLGCGKGKVCHISRGLFPRAKIFGIDLHPKVVEIAKKNLEKTDITIINKNVLEVDYKKLLSGADAVVVFNKISFDKVTTIQSLELIRKNFRLFSTSIPTLCMATYLINSSLSFQWMGGTRTGM